MTLCDLNAKAEYEMNMRTVPDKLSMSLHIIVCCCGSVRRYIDSHCIYACSFALDSHASFMHISLIKQLILSIAACMQNIHAD